MIKYYKLFDLLNRRNMKLSDLRNILSSATVAKLKKGEYISGEVIEKICIFLQCQPGDIMEVVEVEEIDKDTRLIHKDKLFEIPELNDDIPYSETWAESKPTDITFNKSDEIGLTDRQIVKSDNPFSPIS